MTANRQGCTANSVSIIVGQIERYQAKRETSSQWPKRLDVQLDPRKPVGRRPKVVRFIPFSIIAYPCTASLALFLYNHTVPQRAFQEAKAAYPRTYDWDIDHFQRAKYIHPSSIKNVEWEITDRIDCESLYLQEVASYYDPTIDPFEVQGIGDRPTSPSKA